MFSAQREIQLCSLQRWINLTDEYNVIVQLPLILSLSLHLRNMLQGLKHSLHDFFVCRVNESSSLKTIRPHKLALYTSRIGREMLDKMGNTLSFLAAEFGLFDSLQLVMLSNNIALKPGDILSSKQAALTMWRSKAFLMRFCCFPRSERMNWLFFSSAPIRQRSRVTRIATISLAGYGY